jgi:general secretion pathway protein E
MAIQSSLTGHLVLSTVHTNSAAATITRLVDMGVEDYLLASTIKGVLAQRLVRRLCLQCSTPSAELEALLSNLARQHLHTDVDTSRARVARGCPACRNTGFSGRSTIDELLEMTSGVRDALFDKAQERVIEQAATSAGMVSMFCDGLNKVLAGQTTIEEVLRATRVN